MTIESAIAAWEPDGEAARTAKPIIFSAPMVRAILDGRKHQTRRVLKPQPEADRGGMVRFCEGGWFAPHVIEAAMATAGIRPRYARGDRLWVREGLEIGQWGTVWQYRADAAPIRLMRDDPRAPAMIAWAHHQERDRIPSIHMPRWASRITLEVTNVRAERLQEISGEDAIAEGIDPAPHRCGCERCAMTAELCPATASSLIMEFAALWQSIHGPGAWEANPWVVAVSFRRTR